MRKSLALAVPLLLLVPAAAVAAAKPDSQPPPANDRLFLRFIEPDLGLEAEVIEATVLFNPKEIGLDKSVPWGHKKSEGDPTRSPMFTNGEPYRLEFELFFDGYESKTNVSAVAEKLEKFVAPPQAHRPPSVLLTWGTGLEFKCVLESFSLRFTLFLEDGTPVRAVMNTVFKEFTPATNQTRGDPQH